MTFSEWMYATRSSPQEYFRLDAISERAERDREAKEDYKCDVFFNER